MASFLEELLAQGGGNPLMFGGTSGAFPAVAAPVSGEDLWARIEAENAAANAAADRRNANAMTRKPIMPFSFAGPDVSSPGIQFALGNMPPGTMESPLPSLGAPPPDAGPAVADASGPGPMPGAGSAPFLPVPMGPGSVSSAAPVIAPEEDAAIPPNARPAIGPAPAPMSLAPAEPAAEPGMLEQITGGLKSAASGLKGISPALLGVGGALQGDGGATTRAILKEQNDLELTKLSGNATAKALLAKGVPIEDVQAAIRSPEVLKALLVQNYGKDKLSVVQTGENAYGRKTFQVFNSSTGEFKPLLGAGGSANPDQPPLLNDAQKSRVQAIIEGREDYPSPSSRAPDAAIIREAVHNADPAFDAVNYSSRKLTRKDFTSGKSAQNLTAFNTAIGHLGSLYDSIDGLKNSGYKFWNKVANPIAENTDPNFAANLQKFQTARTAVADELTRAFRGSGGNVHDIIQWEAAINSASSPEALRAAVQQAAELLNSRITAVGDQYNRGMGTTKDPMELLNPKASASFQHMLEGGKPKVSAPGGKTALGVPWSVVSQ